MRLDERKTAAELAAAHTREGPTIVPYSCLLAIAEALFEELRGATGNIFTPGQRVRLKHPSTWGRGKHSKAGGKFVRRSSKPGRIVVLRDGTKTPQQYPAEKWEPVVEVE